MAINFYPYTVLTGGGVGALDGEDGAGLAAGDVAFVVLASGVYHYVNVQDSATENSPYVIRPDTNPGTNSWHLVTPQGPMSHVFVNTAAGQSIVNDSNTTIIFDNEVTDTLGEYDHTTGIFTAIYAGTYLINSCIAYSITSVWVIADSIKAFIDVNDAPIVQTYALAPYSSTYRQSALPISTVYTLSAGDNIRIKSRQSAAGNRSLDNSVDFNFLSIDRIV